MNYDKKDIFIASCLMIFIITFSIVFTVFFKQLYYLDINYLGIDLTSGLSSTVIKENYNILINYQSIFYQGALELPAFVMSNSGKIHFQEVKRIFEVIQVLMVISGILSIALVYSRLKEKQFRFFKLTGIITIIIPSFIAILASTNFDQAFVIFHKIAFRNDFWVFDYNKDPVIKILPQEFFMHAFTMIIVIIIALSVGCIMFYNYKTKKLLSE